MSEQDKRDREEAKAWLATSAIPTELANRFTLDAYVAGLRAGRLQYAKPVSEFAAGLVGKGEE
jgi:hypothetical protein